MGAAVVRQATEPGEGALVEESRLSSWAALRCAPLVHRHSTLRYDARDVARLWNEVVREPLGDPVDEQETRLAPILRVEVGTSALRAALAMGRGVVQLALRDRIDGSRAGGRGSQMMRR